ncbi:putative alcohol dehydrogenase [Seiridium cupressi]
MERSGTLYDLDTGNGVQRALRFIDKNEKRQDTAHTYLHLDLEMQNCMYKKQREIVRHTSLSRDELPVGHLPFAPESKAALSGATSPKGSTTPCWRPGYSRTLA